MPNLEYKPEKIKEYLKNATAVEVVPANGGGNNLLKVRKINNDFVSVIVDGSAPFETQTKLVDAFIKCHNIN